MEFTAVRFIIALEGGYFYGTFFIENMLDVATFLTFYLFYAPYFVAAEVAVIRVEVPELT